MSVAETISVADEVARRYRQLDALADEIAELAAHIHAATYRLLRLVAEFDEASGWQGWTSCAHWLSWRTGIGLEASREKVRVARALPALPAVSAAFERGEISYSKVRAITRVATAVTEKLLLQIAVHGTASHVEKTVRGFRRANPDRENSEARRHYEGRYVHTRHDEHGNVIVEARLPAELGERFLQALDAATDATREASRRDTDRITPSQRRADALVLLAGSGVAAGLRGRRAGDTHQVVVHVDAAVLADPAEDGRSEFERAGHVSAEPV